MALTDDRVLQDMLVLEDLRRQRMQDFQDQEAFEQQQQFNELKLERLRQEVDAEPRVPIYPARTAAMPPEVAARQEGSDALDRANAALVRQANGTGAPYALDAQEDLASIAPLVRAGVMGANEVQAIVKSAAMGGIVDQRNSRKARRVMQAIMQQTENGTFNETQTAGALASAEKEFGRETLVQVPEYAQLTGLTEQMKVARDLTKIELAEQYGVEPEVLSFDEDGRLTLDANAVKIKQYKMVVEEVETEKAAKVAEAKRKAIETQVNAIAAQIRSTNTLLSETKDPAYLQVLNRLTVKQHKLLNELGGTGQETADSGAPQPARPDTKRFGSMDEFLSALRTGQHGIGVPANVNGVQWKAGPDGKVRKVL